MLDAIFNYEFLQNAVISGLIIGLIAPLLGVFIVVRRMALISDALSHVTLAGITGGLWLSQHLAFSFLNPIFSGIVASILGSILIERLRALYKHYEELAIPIIMSSGIGLSAVFISLANGFNTDVMSYLFGTVSAVSRQDLWIILAIAIIVLIFLAVFFKELFVLSFDEEYARVSGLPAGSLHFFFMLIVALTIAACMRIVGILLVSSMMTLPVASAMRIAKGFKETMVYSVIFGELAVIIGLILAFYLNLAPGGTIVVTSIFILLMVMIFKRAIRKETQQ